MTTQVRSPRGAQSCIIYARILAHLVDELQPGGSSMRRYAILFALVSLLLPVTAFSQARTPEAAVNLFNKALKKTGNGDFDGAIEDYTRAITLSSRFDTGKKSGNSSAESNDASIEEITVVDPFTANAYVNRGLARFRKGDHAGAIEDYNAALRIRPGLTVAYLNRAAALKASGDTAAAIKDLDKTISLKKDFFQAYTNRGSLHLDRGDPKAALADLNRSIELNDSVGESFYHRGFTHLAMKNFDAAIADFDRAIELEPNRAWSYQGRGAGWMFKGQMVRALENFHRAIEINPKIAWAYLNRGLIWVYLGDEAQAEKDFAAVLRLKPELKAEVEARTDLARHLRRIGQPLQ